LRKITDYGTNSASRQNIHPIQIDKKSG